MKPTYDFYTEETTKSAAENVLSLQKLLATYRGLLHPVNSLSAEVTRMMADTVGTAKNIVGLCTYERDAILFIDGENKEWTRRELIKVLNSTEGTETALQFLLSCAVFGWPEEGTPIRELTVEVLEKLRSIPVEELQTAKDLLN